MDLGTIKKGLESGEIGDPYLFAEKVRLVFQNAFTYNTLVRPSPTHPPTHPTYPPILPTYLPTYPSVLSTPSSSSSHSPTHPPTQTTGGTPRAASRRGAFCHL